MEPHVHMTDGEGNYLDTPDVGDPHGWTVLYQTIACDDHTHRVIGWVGDLPQATKVACVAAALWHPVMRCTPTPAPDSATPGQKIGVITDMPEGMIARVHAGEKFTIDELIAAGATGVTMVDEVMPKPIMIAARVVEILDTMSVDVVTLLDDSGQHDGRQALFRAGGAPLLKTILSEFPERDLSAGTGH